MDWKELCGGVHTAQRQRLMQIFIGLCTHFIMYKSYQYRSRCRAVWMSNNTEGNYSTTRKHSSRTRSTCLLTRREEFLRGIPISWNPTVNFMAPFFHTTPFMAPPSQHPSPSLQPPGQNPSDGTPPGQNPPGHRQTPLKTLPSLNFVCGRKLDIHN